MMLSDFGAALIVRNDVINGILSIPSICTELDANRQEINIISQAVGMQSQDLGKGLNKMLRIEAARIKENSARLDIDNEESFKI